MYATEWHSAVVWLRRWRRRWREEGERRGRGVGSYKLLIAESKCHIEYLVM